jgi:hypothetical protein
MAALTRLIRAWQVMERERRFAALASIALFISMFLPWYQQNGFANTKIESRNLDAFQVFSFVEAAVLLVAMALIYMLFARAEGREFNMPGGDGTVVFAAGLWTGALLVFRLFDKPGISSHGVAANVGVQWGIFFALAAAGMIAYSGSRMRTARGAGHLPRHTRPSRAGGRPPEYEAEPEPRAPDRERPPVATPRREPDPRRRPESRDAAPGDDELLALPGEEPTRNVAVPARAPAPATAGARRRPRFPPSPDEQLSFEDPPPGPQ